MRPKRYPYTKTQWEKEVCKLCAGDNIVYETVLIQTNRLTGEVR